MMSLAICSYDITIVDQNVLTWCLLRTVSWLSISPRMESKHCGLDYMCYRMHLAFFNLTFYIILLTASLSPSTGLCSSF